MRRTSLVVLLAACVAACAAPAPAPTPTNVTPPAPAPPQLGRLSAAARSTDKGPSQHNYTELYERLLFERRDDAIRIFEIGIADGGSLSMWQEYFPKARIFAVDIFEKTKFDNARVTTLVADQANREQLQAAINASGSDIDVLVDDGGHTMEQQQVSLGFLFPHVRPGGYYIVEDVHTSLPALWKGYGVSRDGSNTTLRMLENFVRGSSPEIRSQYMTQPEMAYLTGQIDTVTLSHRPKSRSIVAVIKKKAA